MAERLANGGADFALHYSVRTRRRAAFLERIAASAYSWRVTCYFGDDGQLPATRRQRRPRAAGRRHPLVRMRAAGLHGRGDRRRRARPAGRTSRSTANTSPARCSDTEADLPFDVKLASSGKVIRVAQNQTVLAALTARGVDVAGVLRRGRLRHLPDPRAGRRAGTPRPVPHRRMTAPATTAFCRAVRARPARCWSSTCSRGRTGQSGLSAADAQPWDVSGAAGRSTGAPPHSLP